MKNDYPTEANNYVVKSEGPNRHERRKQNKGKKKQEEDFQKKFKNNNEWSELQKLHQTALSYFSPFNNLMNAINGFNKVLPDGQKVSIASYLSPDEATIFNQNINLLRRDIIEYKKELDMIYAVHSDKTGSCTIDDWGIVMQLMEKYTIWITSVEGTVRPLYDHIADLVTFADHRRVIHENPEMALDILKEKQKVEEHV